MYQQDGFTGCKGDRILVACALRPEFWVDDAQSIDAPRWVLAGACYGVDDINGVHASGVLYTLRGARQI